VINGISWVTFTSASSLFMVITRRRGDDVAGAVAAQRLNERGETLAGVRVVLAERKGGAGADRGAAEVEVVVPWWRSWCCR
jgi:hypothetical protein